VANAVNYLRKPVKVVLVAGAKRRQARDLLTGKTVGAVLTLEPMEPALLAVD
jgi:hypothetical protein